MKNTLITIIVGLMAVVIIDQHLAIQTLHKSLSGQTAPVVTNMPDGSIHIDRLDPGESVVVGISTPLDLEQIFGLSGYKLTDLLDAIEQVESGGDPNAIGDGGDAIGSYQIHKIYVDDVNRILKKEGYSKKYDYADRLDSFSSRVMTIIYCGYWHNEYFPDKYFGVKSSIDLETAERLARIHNGGPDGHKKDSTKPYWQKVKARLEGEQK